MPASDHGHDVAVIVAVAQLGDLPVVQVEGDEASGDAEEHPVGREGSPLVVVRGELGGEGEVGHVHDGGARVEEQVREGVEQMIATTIARTCSPREERDGGSEGWGPGEG